MRLTINGEQYETNSASNVQQLLAELGHTGKRLAVEIDGAIVSRSNYQLTQLVAKQKIEIVIAVGGG